MSRRHAVYHPEPVVFVDWLAVRYGARADADRPMPGCREPECCGGGWPIGLRLSQARTDWQLSGMDLVPVLGAIVGLLAILAGAWRAAGGLL